ncbi:MAG: hypothetical protein CVV14_05205 [Gammaproteobacteria bacterium HGW-Gammaproteobacteria-4]|jgi:hypothetical protein|nr:MAG: hypothetical protein CVV14_05205 [Gammaproteobacteria bacterium HGW-Gammaproteobacteria-4]
MTHARFLPVALLTAASLLATEPVSAQSLDGPQPAPEEAPAAPQVQRLPGDTTLAALVEMVLRIDPEAQANGSAIQFRVQDRNLILVGDENAGRMRIMTPIARTDALDIETVQRMLQANFDAVLDARYAVANGIVWSVFIHPLPPMDEAQLANAIAQVYIAAATFGTTYTSGALVYGGGDSNEEHRKLIDEIKKQIAPEI